MPRGIYPRCDSDYGLHPEYKGRKCLCAECHPVDGICTSPSGCIECDGPVIDCDPSEATLEEQVRQD